MQIEDISFYFPFIVIFPPLLFIDRERSSNFLCRLQFPYIGHILRAIILPDFYLIDYEFFNYTRDISLTYCIPLFECSLGNFYINKLLFKYIVKKSIYFVELYLF